MEHDIDAAHVLSVKGAEIVSRAASEASVGVHVLDDVADVLNAVIRAPPSELTGEAVAV